MTTNNENNLPAPISRSAVAIPPTASGDAARRLVEAFLAGRNKRTMVQEPQKLPRTTRVTNRNHLIQRLRINPRMVTLRLSHKRKRLLKKPGQVKVTKAQIAMRSPHLAMRTLNSRKPPQWMRKISTL